MPGEILRGKVRKRVSRVREYIPSRIVSFSKAKLE